MDTVYVIYFDGQMYKNHNRKCAYLEKKNAKQVVTDETNKVARDLYGFIKYDWYELPYEEKLEYIEEVKKRFEIREFVERK